MAKKQKCNCCECYCEKCKDCWRQPCKIHQPPQKECICNSTGCRCKENEDIIKMIDKTNYASVLTPAFDPPQKEGCKNDTYTYEETLETVKKLSKLMQKEGWEEDLDGIIYSYKVLDKETFHGIIARFIHSLLATERQKIEEMIRAKYEAKNKEKPFVHRLLKQTAKEAYERHQGVLSGLLIAIDIVSKLRTEGGREG